MRRGLAAACALALAGCSSPAQKLAEGTEAVLSWAATAHEVTRVWTARLVPTPYARVALQAFQESVEQERAALAASPRDLADDRIARAASLMAEMSAVAARMLQSVEQADGAGLLRHEQDLYQAEARLRALGATSGS